MTGFIPWSSIDIALRAQRSIWISTTRPDGRPHAVPVWYIWDDRSIYFITQRDVQKAKNLAHQPWIVVHVGNGFLDIFSVPVCSAALCSIIVTV